MRCVATAAEEEEEEAEAADSRSPSREFLSPLLLQKPNMASVADVSTGGAATTAVCGASVSTCTTHRAIHRNKNE